MTSADSRHVSRVRVKICGITRPEDALAAARLGADAIGLVFFPGSPRVVSIETARKITAILPPFVNKVGLFVNAEQQQVWEVLNTVPLDLLQFHGDEEPGDCERYSKPYIKAVRMHNHMDLSKVARQYASASALLLDAFVQGSYGGTGQVFDWSRIPADSGKPLILAGGLTSANIGMAIRQVMPYAVDVSGGVESAKGIKDPGKIEAFIQEVRHAESQPGHSANQRQ